MDTYFQSQVQALAAAEQFANQCGYDVVYPDYIWAEHIGYEKYHDYHFPLVVRKTGNAAKQWLHIVLYRMPSGDYELVTYLN